MNSTRISWEWLKATDDFSVSITHSWLFGVMVMTPDWESVGCEFQYRNFCLWKERPSLTSLILIQNRKNQIINTCDECGQYQYWMVPKHGTVQAVGYRHLIRLPEQPANDTCYRHIFKGLHSIVQGRELVCEVTQLTSSSSSLVLTSCTAISAINVSTAVVVKQT